VAAAPVVKHGDVLEQVARRLVARRVTHAMHSLVLDLLKKLSVGALSQQLPLRDIDPRMP
jgi:hypothetical protein